MQELKQGFRLAKWFKPKSCRKNSFEIYMIGIGFIKKPKVIDEDQNFIESNYTGEMPW